MARFVKQKNLQFAFAPLLSLLFFVAILLMFWQGLKTVSETSEAERLRTATQAIARAAAHCYAVEGIYPPNIEYLEQRYGLSVDRNKYRVDYRCFASNLMPDIIVLPRG